MLSKYGIKVIHVPIELSEPRMGDIREIAKAKVLSAYSKIKKPVIALDSGFYIHSSGGFPGGNVNPTLKNMELR